MYAQHTQISTMIKDNRVQGVSLTGSERAGRAIASQAGEALKKCVLELGGTDAYVVLDSSDVKAAAETAWNKRIGNVGQACTSNKRMIVMDDIYDEFVQALVDLASSYNEGDPLNPGEGNEFYPLSSRDAAELLAQQLRLAVDEGADLRVGGEVTGKQGQAAPHDKDGRGLTDDADADQGGAPSTEGGMQHGQDGAPPRQTGDRREHGTLVDRYLGAGRLELRHR